MDRNLCLQIRSLGHQWSTILVRMEIFPQLLDSLGSLHGTLMANLIINQFMVPDEMSLQLLDVFLQKKDPYIPSPHRMNLYKQ